MTAGRSLLRSLQKGLGRAVRGAAGRATRPAVPPAARIVLATSVVVPLAFAVYWREVASADQGGKPGPSSRIRRDELEKHAKPDDLWVAINGEVWDLTDFAQFHPGGADIIRANAGRDVSELFNAVHPPETLRKKAYQRFLVGSLELLEDKQQAIVPDTGLSRPTAKKSHTVPHIDTICGLRDFEILAETVLPESSRVYFATGADDQASVRHNEPVFSDVYFRPRVARDVRQLDTSTIILGYQASLPIFVSPTARNGLAHPLGEVAVTKGISGEGILQVLSYSATCPLEEVMEARAADQPVAWQLYTRDDRDRVAAELGRAVALGVQSLWITLDTAMLGKRETDRRLVAERRDWTLNVAPMDVSIHRPAPRDVHFKWEDIGWIKKTAPGLPVVLKGIGAWEDVVLAQRHGADAVVLSNHGGRQLDYSRAPLETLYDLHKYSPATLRQPGFQVFLDGGVRRGTDVLKALCLGASAVGLGRPFIYAAATHGPLGVKKAVLILREEIEIGMSLLGVSRLDQLGPGYLDCSRLR